MQTVYFEKIFQIWFGIICYRCWCSFYKDKNVLLKPGGNNYSQYRQKL